MRPLKIGRYRQRVLLYDIPESSKDTWGQPSQTPTPIVNPYAIDGSFAADIVPLKGDEMLDVRQMWPTATHTVYMRWLGDSIPVSADNPQREILPQMVLKAVHNNAYLHVVNANNNEFRDRQWVITCEEKVGAIA